DNIHDRKAEVFKLIKLFSKVTKEEKWLKLAKALHSKPALSPKDCLDAIKHFEKAPVRAEDRELTREEKVTKLLLKAQTIAFPDDQAKQTAERKKLLDEAAALYKDAEQMHKLLKKANVNDNEELDSLIGKIKRVNPMNPKIEGDPEERALEVLFAC